MNENRPEVATLASESCNPKEELGVRIKELRQRLGLPQATAAQQCGMPLDTWKKYEGGRNSPGFDAMVAFSALGANLHWLLTGEGQMLLADAAGEPPPLQVDDLRLAIETIEEALAQTRRTMPPARKAEVVALVYKLYVEGEGKLEKATVLQLVKSAA